MTDPQTAAATRLEADRYETTARLASLRRDFGAMVAASLDSNADDEHDPEGATIAYERSQLDALIHQAERHLADLTAAQARLAQGSYGVCAVCGKAIDPARLEARPVARTCVACA
ncbi:TraR/DksA C4-type zinc finger protein [Nostocoides sp. HKS02]|uniref:TraR/DksA family transcriptional regulator n=1 Tax=Nostocoides sp. HKS02 TaxID=1813880 RepID=UPI0012B4BF75|nr:TraR/DksA C4-type zinc finger protein [Tetrasphaera sp. HKS02]QGN57244.1 TraR/DksA family transcriptional regulator [Tetrasphaera sp. HKS02]